MVATAAAGLVAGFLFVRGELRREHPLFDIRVLRRPVVAAGAIGIICAYFAFLGTLFLLPQYLQYVHDRSVEATGLLLVPLGLGVAVGSHYAPKALDAFGPAHHGPRRAGRARRLRGALHRPGCDHRDRPGDGGHRAVRGLLHPRPPARLPA